MNGADLRSILDAALAAMHEHTDELRRLDAAIGDGDLGITVSDGSTAVRAALEALPEDASTAELARTAGQVFAKANPSTFSALVGMSVMRASATLGADPVGGPEVVAFARELVATIGSKGKSARGDKTVLDALAPAVDALEAGVDGGDDAAAVLEAMIAAARQGVDETAALESRRGRARWLSERSKGHPDGGAVAALRFLEALREVVAGPDTRGASSHPSTGGTAAR